MKTKDQKLTLEEFKNLLSEIKSNDKLNKNEDLDFQEIIILLLRHLSQYNKNETRKHARELSKSKNDYIRENAIIVLNWLGGAKEYSILKDLLLNDRNIKCRSWSASAFMQMWFTRKNKKLRNFALTLFKEALEKEHNYFVLATIIESIREIENKKFSKKKSLDNLDEIEIDKAKTRLLKYLTKTLQSTLL